MIEQLNDLQSSHVESAIYDRAAKEMTIIFKGGNEYRYTNIDPIHWSNMKVAHSVGGYLHKHILAHQKGVKLTQ